jgi:hypothetical protein
VTQGAVPLGHDFSSSFSFFALILVLFWQENQKPFLVLACQGQVIISDSRAALAGKSEK